MSAGERNGDMSRQTAVMAVSLSPLAARADRFRRGDHRRDGR
jgi:hypothetical protein